MTDVRIKLLAYMLAVIALISIGFAAAWVWQANAYGQVIASAQSDHQKDLATVSAAGTKQAREALAKQQSAEQKLAALDKTATEQKGKLNAENDTLRRAVADGTRRLRIAGSCSAVGGNMPGTTSAAGVGDAGAIELDRETGQAVLDLRRDIIADQAALRAAQLYIKNVCR